MIHNNPISRPKNTTIDVSFFVYSALFLLHSICCVSGRILNRFSKDIGTMDEQLPKVMLEALQMTFVICGILVMEAIINQWMLIPIIILIVLFLLGTKFYLKTAQNVKRLEGIGKYWKNYEKKSRKISFHFLIFLYNSSLRQKKIHTLSLMVLGS